MHSQGSWQVPVLRPDIRLRATDSAHVPNLGWFPDMTMAPREVLLARTATHGSWVPSTDVPVSIGSIVINNRAAACGMLCGV